MLSRQVYRDCIKGALAGKGFGEKRTEEVLKIFERHVKILERQGGTPHHTIDFHAMQATHNEVSFLAREKMKRATKNFSVLALIKDQVVHGANIPTSILAGDKDAGLSGGQGTGIAYGIASIIRHDPRTPSLDYDNGQKSLYGKYWALMGDVLDNFSKGAFGSQRGKAHLNNFISEFEGTDTGDAIAKEIATAYRKTDDIMVDDRNRFGGSLRKLENYLPQKRNRAKLIEAGMVKWVADQHEFLDWNQVMRENGDLIPLEERDAFLQQSYRTLFSDGANKISDTAMRGTGSAIGNQLDSHRILVYKKGMWIKNHELYGDGNVFDVISDHITRMSRQNAQIDAFGTNPGVWIQNANAIGRKYAEELQSRLEAAGKRDKKTKTIVTDFDTSMRRVKDIFDGFMHQNSMDEHSRLGATSVAVANVLTSAQLGSAFIPAILGDSVITAGVRMLNHSPFAVGVGKYTKAMTPGGYHNFEKFMAREAFIFDDTTSPHYAAERFTGMTTHAAPITRRISDSVLRLTWLNRHTNVGRGVNQMEQMGLLDDYRHAEFENLPFRHVFDRYGITKRDWDVVRKLQPSSPNGGMATFFRPLDILNTNLIDKDRLFQKFFSFVHQESNNMVLASTIEASIMAKGLTRPDSIHGLVMHSFAMYKNFPATFAMTMGRLALSRPGTMTRVGFIGGVAVGLTFMGAMANQINELRKGRTPLPMDNWNFWGKAFFKGGAAGVWGDYLLGGSNEYGRELKSTLGGPIVGFASDVKSLVAGSVDDSGAWDANFPGRAVEFAKRYTPGSNIWWAQLALEHEFFNRLQYAVDPKAQQKWRRKAQKHDKDFGNTHWLKPGETLSGDRL